MAKYGDTQEFTYTDPKGKATEFLLRHVGLMGADDMLDEVRGENGQVSMKAYREYLFEHVIRAKDGGKVNYAFFEEQEFGRNMLEEVTKAARAYIFQKA